jgi:DNA invertase Pin-like site-specific DNA recombinase
METTGHYVTRIESDKGGAIARIAIYARLSRDPRGLNVNTSIQVAECLEEARRYVQDRVLQARIVAIFEENDISASAYSKKKRLDFQRLIELIKRNKIDIILATEVERLVRQPA